MFVVSVLIFCLALVVTPFPSVRSLTGDPTEEEIGRKKYGRLFDALTRRNPLSHNIVKTLKGKGEKNADLGLVVAEVATRLRSGAQPDEAWYQSLKVFHDDAQEKGIDEHGVPYALRALWKKPRRLWKKRSNDQTQLAIPAAIAVCRLSHSSGAPIADVLDSCASGITEAAEAASARSVALAGPQTSAQMLAWMPLLGVVLGSALGAEPLHFLFLTMGGRCILFLGIVCEIAGIVWIRKLVARAENL